MVLHTSLDFGPLHRCNGPKSREQGRQNKATGIDERPGEETPYERLLGDAMAGNGALFTREDAVEAAWAVVDPVLTKHQGIKPYKRGSWGPGEANALIAADGCWRNPSQRLV